MRMNAMGKATENSEAGLTMKGQGHHPGVQVLVRQIFDWMLLGAFVEM